MVTDFKDPAPSKFFYKLNRLAYKLWFKLLLFSLALSAFLLLARIFVFEKLDFNESFISIKNNAFLYFENISEYKVNKVEVLGASEQLALEIEDLVKNTLSGKISTLNVSNIREKIIRMARVKNAFVKLTAKGNIKVEVIERKGLAVLSEGKSYVLLDEEGVRISSFVDWRALPNLPILVGKGADSQLKEFVSLHHKRLHSLISEIEFYEWVGERRWNLHFKSKLVIKLPEKNLGKGLELLSVFIEKGFLDNDKISVIDLRDVHRPFIRFKNSSIAKTYAHIL